MVFLFCMHCCENYLQSQALSLCILKAFRVMSGSHTWVPASIGFGIVVKPVLTHVTVSLPRFHLHSHDRGQPNVDDVDTVSSSKSLLPMPWNVDVDVDVDVNDVGSAAVVSTVKSCRTTAASPTSDCRLLVSLIVTSFHLKETKFKIEINPLAMVVAQAVEQRHSVQASRIRIPG